MSHDSKKPENELDPEPLDLVDEGLPGEPDQKEITILERVIGTTTSGLKKLQERAETTIRHARHELNERWENLGYFEEEEEEEEEK